MIWHRRRRDALPCLSLLIQLLRKLLPAAGSQQHFPVRLHLFGRRRRAPRTLRQPTLWRSLLRLTLRRLPLQLTLPLLCR